MIDPRFPNKEKLRHMSLLELRSLRVLYPEEEQLLQDAVHYKLSLDKRPAKVEIFENDIKGAHIATKEQELKAQEVLNNRRKEALKQMNMSEEDLKMELEKIDNSYEKSEPKSDIKCELCGSRGFRHKKGCPTLNK